MLLVVLLLPSAWKKHLLCYCVKLAQSCLTLCSPVDYTDHGVLQARILEWVAFSLLQGIFPTQELNRVLLHCRQILYQLRYQGSPDREKDLTWMCGLITGCRFFDTSPEKQGLYLLPLNRGESLLAEAMLCDSPSWS